MLFITFEKIYAQFHNTPLILMKGSTAKYGYQVEVQYFVV